ncbi:MAG: hypothetical protein R3266_05630 [Gemmatimonadota bacterium]|nr:hypothetical protein [Gemmatimonadota bacterium]
MIAAAALLFGPVPTDAQPTPPDPVVDAPDPAAMLARADELVASRARWYEAALLYQEAARLLSEDDPLVVRSLRRSAQLLHSLGSFVMAGETLEFAGSVALSHGNSLEAAECFLEAAFVAQERGAAEERERLGRMVRVLAASPLVTGDQRDRLLSHLQTSQEVTRR